jgi:hypothetical protein
LSPDNSIPVCCPLAGLGHGPCAPRPAPRPRTLYEYHFRNVDQVSRQAVWHEIAAYLYRRMGAPTKVLDPAAGRCEFINAVPAAEQWAVDTVDHNEFRHPDVKLMIADILDADLPPAYFDGIFVSNFLEHLPSQDTVPAAGWRTRRGTAPGRGS